MRNRARRVLLPLAIFWPAIVPLGGLGFVFAVRRLGADLPLLPVPDQPLLRQPILGHLWFLYYLLIFYTAALVIVPLAARLPASVRRSGAATGRALGARPWGAIVLGMITMITLLPMTAAGLDTSAELLPPLRVLAAYGVFFVFGWLLYGNRDLIPSFGYTMVGPGCVRDRSKRRLPLCRGRAAVHEREDVSSHRDRARGRVGLDVGFRGPGSLRPLR